MADRKRLTADVRFNFTGTAKKQMPLVIIQLAVVLGFAIFEIVQLVRYGFSWLHAGMMAGWIFCGYLIIRNARRALNAKAGEKARENGIQEPQFVTPVPESDQDKENPSEDT